MPNNRFYVYVHICKFSKDVKYIGKGTDARYKHKSNRTKLHRSLWDTLNKKILIHSLTEQDACDIEHRLISDAIACGRKLLNVLTKRTEVREVSYEKFKDVFEYSESSPSGLVNKQSRPYNRNAGDTVGSLMKDYGYWIVSYERKKYYAHRVVYALCHKVALREDMVIDHIDANPSNNRIENLQQISRSKNNMKASISKKNKSGVTGVSWSERWGTWTVSWNVNKESFTKGFIVSKLYPDMDFEEAKQLTFEDAVTFRKKMENLYYSMEWVL